MSGVSANGVEHLPQSIGDCGVEVSWNPDDLQEVTEHHRELWREEKASWGLTPKEPVEWLPGFKESVQRLLDQGYTYTDIGAFFGVTRECVRLWAKRYDLERMGHYSTKPRIWSWEKKRFVSVSNEEYVQRTREAVLTKRRERVEERKQRVVETIKAMAEELGRPPALTELEERLGVYFQNLAHDWGVVPHRSDVGLTYVQAWDAMYADAGVTRLRNTSTAEEGRWWGRGTNSQEES